MTTPIDYAKIRKMDESLTILQDALWYYYATRVQPRLNDDDVDNLVQQGVLVVDEVMTSYPTVTTLANEDAQHQARL